MVVLDVQAKAMEVWELQVRSFQYAVRNVATGQGNIRLSDRPEADMRVSRCPDPDLAPLVQCSLLLS